MKNTLSLIGAIVLGIGIVVTGCIIVKKYLDNKAEKKKKEDEELMECDCCDLGFDDEDGLNWEDIPVEEDEEDIIAESIKELDDLDGADK